MALNLNEEATLTLKAQTGQFNTEMKALDERSKDLLKTLKEIEKTGDGKKSEQWRAVKTELDNTRKAAESMRKEVDITTLSYGQLENHVRQLARDLKTLKPGTDEFTAASAKLQTAKNYLDQVTASTKGVSTATKQATKDLTGLADSGLTFGELKTKVEQLKARLQTLSPDAQEFISTSKQLVMTQQYLDKVTASTKGVSTATKQATKDLTGISGAQLTFGELKTKVEQLKAKLDTLSPTSKEFISTSKQLQITEKYYNSVKNSVDDASKAMNRQIVEAKNSDLTFGQLETKVKLLNEQLKKLKPNTEEFARATKNLQETEKSFSAVQKQVKGVQQESEELAKPTRWQKITGGVGSVATAFQAFMALQVISYIIDIGKAIFETTAKFEKYEKILTTALGSEKLAKESMAALKQLGKDTAFSVDELTEGYVKMVNRGLRPSQKEMVAMTDLAASQGKTFDDLVEAALDAATGEMERLKEFGIKAKKEGDNVTFSFKGMNQTVKNTPEAINAAIIAFGSMQGVAGQNAKMMETLSGKLSNAGDGLDDLKVTIGEKLMPIFTGLLGGFSNGVQWLQKIVTASDPVIAVFSDLFDVLSDVSNSFLDMIRSIFPKSIEGSNGVKIAMQAIGLVLRALLVPVQLGIAAMMEMYQVMQGLIYAGKAVAKVLTGDFSGAVSSFEQSKAAFTKVGDASKTAFDKMAKGWRDAMVEAPKKAAPEAVFAAAATEKGRQDGMTEEQKKAQKAREKEAEKNRKKEEKDHQKHLDEVKKANEKALIELSKIESDAYIASIKDEQVRDMVKLQVKRDQRAEEIMRTVSDKKVQDAQIKALDKQLELDITNLHAEQTEKRRKKAEEEERKRLEVEKMIIAQQQQAESALLDWRELSAKGNSQKLTDIARDRANVQLRLTTEKLNTEEAAEKAKAVREATTTEQAEAAKSAIESRYHADRQLASKKHADELLRIEQELKDKKNAVWTSAGNAFSALLKGDLMAFVDHAAKMVEGEKQAWQKRIEENFAKYQAVAQMATAAVQFLNQLEQQKAERAIAIARRERDEKVAILQSQLEGEKALQEAAEAEKRRITEASDETIRAIKASSQQTISGLEQQYRELSSSQEKAKLDQQLASYKENADGKSEAAKDTAQDAIEAAQREAKESIAAAQQTEKETIRAVNNEKSQKIDAAEAARDAEVAAIKNRKDVDQATRQQLLAEAKAKFEAEKKMAQDEAQEKIDQAKKTATQQKELAQETSKLKQELAKDTQDAELKAIEAVQKGDEKAAKEILAKAKEDQKEKIRLAKEEADKKIEEAEKEKREKLKKIEAEKQTRIQNQKELNRSIEAENAKSAAIERAAKQKAWEAQKKADIATALITGALATLKALASSIWPANLVFAAMSAVMTGVQVALIKRQAMPSFERGGFIPSGGRHGSVYGTGGLAIVDRHTGREQGEMEGGEAIISREQTQANLGLIRRMFANARTPGKRHQPVDREPIGFRDGGVMAPQGWQQTMYLFGGMVGRKAPRRYSEGGMADYEPQPENMGIDTAEAKAAGERAEAQGKEQLKLLADIKEGITTLGTTQTTALTGLETSLKNAISNRSLADQMARVQTTTTVTTAIAKMRDDVVLALGNTSSKQSNESDQLARQIQMGLTGLETGLKTALSAHGTGLLTALALSRLNNTLGLNTLGQNVRKAIDDLEQSNTEQLAMLRLTNQTGFASLRNQSKADLEMLEKALEKNGEKTVASITKASLSSQLTLTRLEKATVKSLDELSKDVTTSLDELSKDVTTSLDELNTDTKKSLLTLGNQTETALKQSTDRTTRSVDSLSVEVRSLKGSIQAVEGAVYQARNAAQGVEGAVWATNQAGRLDALIGAISTFGG